MDDKADLSHLADIVVPAPVSWSPPAPGWWILGAALLIAATILVRRAFLKYRSNAYRRAAIAELAATGPIVNGAGLVAVSSTLKRAALVAYPRLEVASLTGAAWLAFLDRAVGTDAFTKGPAAGLGQAAFATQVDDGEAILGAARRWITRHRIARHGIGQHGVEA
jgi:hypothetical protein